MEFKLKFDSEFFWFFWERNQEKIKETSNFLRLHSTIFLLSEFISPRLDLIFEITICFSFLYFFLDKSSYSFIFWKGSNEWVNEKERRFIKLQLPSNCFLAHLTSSFWACVSVYQLKILFFSLIVKILSLSSPCSSLYLLIWQFFYFTKDSA